MVHLLNSAYDSVSSAFRWGLVRTIATGPVPQHIGFVMDGNRRYARQRNMEIKQGHTDGFYTLQRVLEICLRLGVKCVTVFAFSIENFKRSEDEVNALMELAETKLIELTKHGKMLDEYGVRLNVLGKVEMLPESVQDSVRIAQEMTKNNNKSILNLCMPYTSRDEIATAVHSAVQERVEGDLDLMEHQITEEDIERYMMTNLGGSPPLDILVRSSGVKRFSDFLMWQASENVQIHFTPTYWPDIGLWDLLPVILDYQTKVWSQQGISWAPDQWVSLAIECALFAVTVTLFDLARGNWGLMGASLFSINQV